jgi:hypothetical protein
MESADPGGTPEALANEPSARSQRWSRQRAPFAAAVVALTAVGLWLRYRDLGEQLILDDEWHGLRRASEFGALELASRHFKGATSIPTNVFHRLLLDYWGWSEVSVRALSIAATAATLVGFPLAVGHAFRSRWLGVLTGVSFALSPFWIFYGESSRPYAPFLFFTLSGLYCLCRTKASTRLWPWLGYGASAAVAAYFHLFALPAFAVAALVPLWRVISTLRRGARPESDGVASWWSPALRRELVFQAIGHGLAVALLVAFYAAPVQNGMFDALPVQRGDSLLNERLLRHGLELLAGTRSAAVGAVLLAAAAFGLVHGARQNREFVALLAASAAGSLLFMLLTEPYDHHVALVALRYNVTLFPLFFLGLASAAQVAVERLATASPARARAWALGAAFLAYCGLSFALSPLPALLAVRPNNFRLHSAYQQNYGNWRRDRAYDSDMFRDGLVQTAAGLPPFYRELGAADRPCVLVEYPPRIPDAWNPYYFYQQHHGCRVKIGYSRRGEVGAVLGGLPPERRRFRHFINIEDEAELRASGADYLVLHVDLDRENEAAQRAPLPGEEIRRIEGRLKAHLGPPIYEDPQLHVFPLAP